MRVTLSLRGSLPVAAIAVLCVACSSAPPATRAEIDPVVEDSDCPNPAHGLKIDPRDCDPPRVLKYLAPMYPSRAARSDLVGTVWVDATIDCTGVVKSAKVWKTTASIFNDAAVKAVKSWTFRPSTYRGTPMTVHFIVKIHFAPPKKHYRSSWVSRGPGQLPAQAPD